VETALAAALADLARAVDAGDRSRLLGYVGNAERLLGRHAEAIDHLRESVQAAPPGDVRARAVALIRLGEAYRCADRPDEAERCLREALQLSDDARLDIRDFALQHLGKCLVDAGRHEEATRLLEEALALRRAKGAADLVASTARALEWARAGGRAT
jgi:tetratricopeptide (TPR) repeat protein